MVAIDEPNKVLRALGEQYSVDILEAAEETASVQELSEQLDAPLTTCYRRVEKLLDTGLLKLEDSILTDGQQRVNVYRRNVDEITARFDDGRLSLSIEERSQVTNKLDDVWRQLPDST